MQIQFGRMVPLSGAVFLLVHITLFYQSNYGNSHFLQRSLESEFWNQGCESAKENVDQDPSFHFDADPDPTFHFDAGPDLDPGPATAPHQSDANLRPLVYRPFTAPL
jgi:hypothetical protein